MVCIIVKLKIFGYYYPQTTHTWGNMGCFLQLDSFMNVVCVFLCMVYMRLMCIILLQLEFQFTFTTIYKDHHLLHHSMRVICSIDIFEASIHLVFIILSFN